MAQAPEQHTSWIRRVKLLDDMPARPGADGEMGALDLLGLDELAGSLAVSLMRNAGNPLVVHVDGAWGRGKTSFCHALETQLERLQSRLGESEDLGDAQSVNVAWYVASDAQPTGQRAIMYQVLRAVLGEDPEEIASVMRQFDVDGNGDGEPTFDRFRAWLGKELGWASRQTGTTRVSIPLPMSRAPDADPPPPTTTTHNAADPKQSAAPQSGGMSGRLQFQTHPPPRRLAVIVIDDLDRCGPDWVAALLDTLRRYVSCRGVSFVVAADRVVIEKAFHTVVENLGVPDERSGAEALEKYIRHSIRIPRWNADRNPRLGDGLGRLQQQMHLGDGPLPLLMAPTPDLKLGLAFKLAIYLPNTLSVRRLKRVLNRFALSVSHFAELAGVQPDDVAIEPQGVAWAEIEKTTPVFGMPIPRRETFAGFFFGQVILATLDEVWPEALAGPPLDSPEFAQRIRTLGMLGAGLRSRREGAPDMLTTGQFEAFADALVDVGGANGKSVLVKREVCEFIASVYADLGLDGRFRPREAIIVSPQPTRPKTPAPPRRTAQPAPSPRQTRLGRRVAESAAAAIGPLNDDRLKRYVADIFQTAEMVDRAPDVPLPAFYAWLIDFAASLEPEPSAELQAALGAFVERPWPVEAGFAVVEYARELARLGLAVPAFDLLARAYQRQDELPPTTMHQGQATAMLWSMARELIDLARRYPFLGQRLRAVTGFPPSRQPDSADAWQAALDLIELDRDANETSGVAHALRQDLVNALQVVMSMSPTLRWPKRLLTTLIDGSDPSQMTILREIGEALEATSQPMDDDDIEMARAVARTFSDWTPERELAIRLYRKLEGWDALAASDLHPLALLYRDAGQVDQAGLCWEQAYRSGALDPAAQREFVNLLRSSDAEKFAAQIEDGEPLGDGDHPFEGAPPKVSERVLDLSPPQSLDADVNALALLGQLRAVTPIPPDLAGPFGALLPLLFGQASVQVPRDQLRVEATAWVEAEPPADAGLIIDLATTFASLDLQAEARALIQDAIVRLMAETPLADQLLWRLAATEADLLGLDAPGAVGPPARMIEAPPGGEALSRHAWNLAAATAATEPSAPLGGILLQDAVAAMPLEPGRGTPIWLQRAVTSLLQGDGYPLPPFDWLLQTLIDARKDEQVDVDAIFTAARTLFLSAPYGAIWPPGGVDFLVETAERVPFAKADFASLANSLPDDPNPAPSRLRVLATAYVIDPSGAGPWAQTLAQAAAEASGDASVKARIETGLDAPELEKLFDLLPIAEDSDG